MRMIMLAAGRGERLMPLTHSVPKSLIDVGEGRVVLDVQVAQARRSRVVSELVLVVGHLADMVERHAAALSGPDLPIRTLLNPCFAVSNNLVSLWLARDEMNRDFMITNGDTLFTHDVYAGLAAAARPEGVALAVCPRQGFDSDDMKVLIERDRVVAVSKALPAHVCHAESPGLLAVRGPSARRAVFNSLERLVRDPKNVDRFWLEVLNDLAATGIAVRPWTFDGSGTWQEIDFHADMERARDLLLSKLGQFRGLAS